MDVDFDEIAAPHLFGPEKYVWHQMNDLHPRPSRGQRISVGAPYYLPVGVFLVSEQRFNEIAEAALSWLRNVLNRSDEIGRTYLLDLNEADLNRVHRIAGHPPTASFGGVWEAPEDSLHHIFTAAVESIGVPMWGCWLDPAQQELVRENGQPALEVFTVLDAKFAEHLDLTALTDAAGTVLVVWWPLHSWRLPPFGGEHIETESEAADRRERDRIRRPPKPRPRPHTL